MNVEYLEPIDLELKFSAKVASPVYTGRTITGEGGDNDGHESINIMLVDRKTRQKVTNGREASLKVKIVLIHGDFCGVTGDEGVWTHLEFEKNIVVNFEKKKNLLLGDLSLVLKDGSGRIGNIRIKHDRNPLRNVKFRLGAMVDDDYDYPHAIKQAISYPFDVKDRRNESKNTRPLSPNDMVWQLVNVSKKGPIRKRLENKNVRTIRDFLSMHCSNPRVLKEICGIKGKKWEMTINHAKTSFNENLYNVYQLVGSTSQQKNSITLSDYEDNIKFDYNCYKPQLCDDEAPSSNMIADCNFSIQDVEICDFTFMEPNVGGVAKKRWMKLRATLWFSIYGVLRIEN